MYACRVSKGGDESGVMTGRAVQEPMVRRTRERKVKERMDARDQSSVDRSLESRTMTITGAYPVVPASSSSTDKSSRSDSLMAETYV